MADTNYYFLLLHTVSLNISYSPDGQHSNSLKFHFSLRGRGFLNGEFCTENPKLQHHEPVSYSQLGSSTYINKGVGMVSKIAEHYFK